MVLYGVGLLDGGGPLVNGLFLLDESDGGFYVFFAGFEGVACCKYAFAVGGVGSELVFACADVND